MPETLTKSELEDLDNAGKGVVDTLDDVSLDDAGKGDTSRSPEKALQPEADHRRAHVGDTALDGFGVTPSLAELDAMLADAAAEGRRQAEEL